MHKNGTSLPAAVNFLLPVTVLREASNQRPIGSSVSTSDALSAVAAAESSAAAAAAADLVASVSYAATAAPATAEYFSKFSYPLLLVNSDHFFKQLLSLFQIRHGCFRGRLQSGLF